MPGSAGSRFPTLHPRFRRCRAPALRRRIFRSYGPAGHRSRACPQRARLPGGEPRPASASGGGGGIGTDSTAGSAFCSDRARPQRGLLRRRTGPGRFASRSRGNRLFLSLPIPANLCRTRGSARPGSGPAESWPTHPPNPRAGSTASRIPMTTLYLASGNAHKLHELQTALDQAGLSIEVLDRMRSEGCPRSRRPAPPSKPTPCSRLTDCARSDPAKAGFSPMTAGSRSMPWKAAPA